ncbi:MAG: ADP-ribosylglycohydrolase family protein [Desulfopila sp.]|jgi:ADP-ribosylglycohydrolase|nr:ADP-ribosylglycohydrolase family protein [Desulfopila sp.]
MKDRYTAMVLASFAGDALALGVHWIYDTAQIERITGKITNYLDPQPNSYHSSKSKGDFTHYGDQTLVLLKSLGGREEFDLELFFSKWREFMLGTHGYLDRASKTTLANIKEGRSPNHSGSFSTDLGGSARIAPLLFACRNEYDTLLKFVLQQTAMTHNSAAALYGAEFLCHLTWEVLHGTEPREAVRKILSGGRADNDLDLKLRSACEHSQESTSALIRKYGQACSITDALPGVVHLVMKYQDNLREALQENVMAGGDSAARGLAVGMVLGAHLGIKAIPDSWIREMNNGPEIMALLKKIHQKEEG